MNNLIKIGLGLALAVVYPFMVGFGIEAFYPPPEHAYQACLPLQPENKLSATDPAQPIPYRDPQSDPQYKQCYDSAQEKHDIYNRNLFLITAALGFFAMAVGALLFSENLGPVGPGLVFGGLFTILYGTGRSFRSIDKRYLFLELLLIFIGIIAITWRYLKTTKQKK